MKRHSLLIVWIICAPLTVWAETGLDKEHSAKYAGYQTDGRTSASVLSAKRSHSVSPQDELGLTLFSAFFVIGAIAFAANFLEKR